VRIVTKLSLCQQLLLSVVNVMMCVLLCTGLVYLHYLTDRLIFKMQWHNYKLIITIIHILLKTLLSFPLTVIDNVCILFSRAVLSHRMLHESFGVGLGSEISLGLEKKSHLHHWNINISFRWPFFPSTWKPNPKPRFIKELLVCRA